MTPQQESWLGLRGKYAGAADDAVSLINFFALDDRGQRALPSAEKCKEFDGKNSIIARRLITTGALDKSKTTAPSHQNGPSVRSHQNCGVGRSRNK
jgi:hypothetical protein